MKERFKNIDFLRFIFAVLIVIFHFHPAYNIEHYLHGISHSNICVDFFFIIAGFFLFYTINTTQSTIDFARKRFLRLAPLVWFFLLIVAILSIFSDGIKFHFSECILRILLLNNIGFGPAAGGIAGRIHWFIPVLFWVTLFYFYIAKIVDKKYLNFIIWMITIFSYGLFFNYMHFKTDGNTTNIYYVFNTGVLRALGGIGLGYFISELYKSGFLQKTTKVAKVVISVIEVYICCFLAHYMLFASKLPAKTGFSLIVVFSVLFYLFLIRQGILTKLLNNNLSVRLGSYSYAIYVMHPIIPAIFKNFIHSKYLISHNIIYFIIQVTCAVIFGIITHYAFEKPINKLIKRTKS